MRKKTKICLSCGERPPRKLVAERKDAATGKVMEFVNSAPFPVFCSVRCAANWALLWCWSGWDNDQLRENGLIPEGDDESEGDDDDD